jgi:acyl-CoA synthetase (AMP-forming)/AMP-acid ligase II
MTVHPRGVFDVLDAPVSKHPDAPALVTASARLSYGEFDAIADRAAGALYALGARPGQRVAVALPNDVDIVAAFHGAMRLGVIWVGINRLLAPPEKAYVVSDSESSLVLADDAACAELDGRIDPPATRLISPSLWRDALETSTGRPPNVPYPDPDAPAGIAYTSGTTGFPKGAIHCQAGLILPGAATVARRGWGPDLRKGDSLALNILNMMVLTTLLTAQAGGVSIIMDRGDVTSIVDWIHREQVTIWNGPPAQLHTMVTDPAVTPELLASLTEVWSGGGDTPDRLRDAFEAKFGVRVSRTYGLTEAPALVTVDDPTDDRPAGTSGRPLDHIEITIDNEEILLGATTVGPWAGAYRPFHGYWKQPEATEKALAGNKLHTGDLGSMEPGGHLRVVGRKSQVIIRGGANVYPAEVERVLSAAPGVGGCAVAGVPDERLGERVGAAIEPAGNDPASCDIGAIVAFCREQLAAYKVPERFVVVERLPRNQMGKVPPAEVRTLLQREGTAPPKESRAPR